MELKFKVLRILSPDGLNEQIQIPTNKSAIFRTIHCRASAVISVMNILDYENNTSRGFPTQEMKDICCVNIAGIHYVVFGSCEEILEMISSYEPKF